MEQFGILETKNQFSLLNNLSINQLQTLCLRRGINTIGVVKKYDLIILFIQWYNNIKYNSYNGIVSGFIVSERGARKHMEDSFVINSVGNISIYGVFDGHGGGYVSKNLPEYCNSILLPKLNDGITTEKIVKSFLEIDKKYYNLWNRNMFGTDGSTASIVIQSKNMLYFVNLGDSRTVLYNDAGVYFSSRDHKPTRVDEYERIETSRYNVVMKDVGRIGGLLAVSRSFGDFIYKIDDDDTYRPVDYAVSVVPEVDVVDISLFKNSKYKFVVCATDGLWDVFSNREVYEYILRNKLSGNSNKTIMRDLVNLAYQRGSTDNITVVYVEL